MVKTLQTMQEAHRVTTAGVLEALQQLAARAPIPAATAGTAGIGISTALRKLQERDPEFPPYDGNPETFLPWIVSVEEKKVNRKLDDQVAITFAINALGSHARGTAGDGQAFASWEEFVIHLKKRFCPDSFEYNVAWRLDRLKVENGNFQFYVSQFMLGARLLKGSEIVPELMLRYFFIQGLEPDMQAEMINKKFLALEATIEAALEYYRKPRAPPQVIVMTGPQGAAQAVPARTPGMDLDALQYGNSPFGGRPVFEAHRTSSYDMRHLPRGGVAMLSASSAGGLLDVNSEWAETTSGEFLGALADNREVMYREQGQASHNASIPSSPGTNPGLNATRTQGSRMPPPRGGGPRPYGDRGRGRGFPGRGFPRGVGGRWPSRPVVLGRGNSADSGARSASFTTAGETAFAKSPMDEVRQRQEREHCFFCGNVGHVLRDCPQAVTQLAQGVPVRGAAPAEGTVPVSIKRPESSLK
jgi:hypothetical protein